MPQTDAAVAPRGRRIVPSLTASRVAVIAAGAGTAGLFLARTLSWPSASSYDAWAYEAWGQALARGEQLVYNAATTPKPLASMLAAVVSPVPPTRAMAIVVALALGALVAGLLAAGFRQAGALAGALSVAAFVFTVRLDEVVWFSLIDGVTAAIVVAAVACTGRTRMVLLILSGLLRPEGWLASALGGYVETAGSRARKALFAVAAGALPFVLWMAFDLLVTGELFATRRFQEGVGAELGGRMPQGPGEALELFWRKTVAEGGALVPVLGFVGLLVHAWRERRTADFPFPLGLAGVWAIALIAETIYGFELNSRYILPLLALLALGCGLLAPDLLSSLASRRPAWMWTATAVAIAATSLALARMDFGRRAERWEGISLTAHRSIPAVEPVVQCGRLGLVGRKHVGGTIGQLGAMTRTSLARFERVGEGAPSRYAGILAVNGSQADRLPPWPVKQTPLGPLAVNPNCQAAGDE